MVDRRLSRLGWRVLWSWFASGTNSTVPWCGYSVASGRGVCSSTITSPPRSSWLRSSSAARSISCSRPWTSRTGSAPWTRWPPAAAFGGWTVAARPKSSCPCWSRGTLSASARAVHRVAHRGRSLRPRREPRRFCAVAGGHGHRVADGPSAPLRRSPQVDGTQLRARDVDRAQPGRQRRRHDRPDAPGGHDLPRERGADDLQRRELERRGQGLVRKK